MTRTLFVGALFACCVCSGGGCVEAREGTLGAACSEKEHCVTDYCLYEELYGEPTGWTDGYCSAACEVGCGDAGVCLSTGQGEMCARRCEVAADCRDGYLCNPWLNACLPDCREGWDCGDEWTCDEDGHCNVHPPAAGEGMELGEPCEGNGDCYSLYCIAEERTTDGIAWRGGVCSTSCDECPSGFSCADFGEEAFCLQDCTMNVDCRIGYVCSFDWKVCLPDCRTGFSCGDEMVCNPAGDCMMPPPGAGGDADSGRPGPGPGDGRW